MVKAEHPLLIAFFQLLTLSVEQNLQQGSGFSEPGHFQLQHYMLEYLMSSAVAWERDLELLDAHSLQVACNGFVPSIVIVAAAVISNGVDLPLIRTVQGASLSRYTALLAGFLSYYSCCCGDTWASELGQLSSETPKLITTLRPVRKVS